MFGKLICYTLGLIMFTLCRVPDTAEGITVYEYGIHEEGEEITFAMKGIIPAMTQIHTANTTFPPKPGFENKLSFLKVEYDSPMSPVEVTFNPFTSVLMFYVRFPFIDIPFGAIGYSLKANQSENERLRSGSKCKCNKNNQRLFRNFCLV